MGYFDRLFKELGIVAPDKKSDNDKLNDKREGGEKHENSDLEKTVQELIKREEDTQKDMKITAEILSGYAEELKKKEQEIEYLQEFNLKLAKMAPIDSKEESVSDILRAQDWHPTNERKK